MEPREPAGSSRTVMYLCYGAGLHVEETVFSLLTAFRHLPPTTPGYRYVVYTDQPDAFADLGVSTHPLDAAELDAWMGGLDYRHRRKTMAILDALARYPGDLAFIDCDTYFLRSPARLFERIGPGRSCLHVLEAHLLQSRTDIDKALSDLITAEPLFDRAGRRLAFSANAPMWNSGVVGINSADAPLLEEALGITDQIWRKVRVHHVEQFATGYFLARNQISECRDIVFHYWAEYMRIPFRQQLPGLLARRAGQPLAARIADAYAHRPRPTPSRWVKVRVRDVLRQMGFNVPGMLKSA